MGLARARRAEKQHVAALTEEASAGQVVDLLLVDRPIERPVELVERLLIAEHGGLGAAFDESVTADEEFVLKDEFEELGVGQLVTCCLLQAYVERSCQAGQPQLPEVLFQCFVHDFISFERLVLTVSSVKLEQPGRRIGQCGDATRAPRQGSKMDEGEPRIGAPLFAS